MSSWMFDSWVLGIVLALVAHLLADFPFQSNEVAAHKGSSNHHLFEHGFWIFIFFCLALTPFVGLVIAALFALGQVVTHLSIDRLKAQITDKVLVAKGGEWTPRPALFSLLDQFLHLTVILVSFRLLTTFFPHWADGGSGLGQILETITGLPAGDGLPAALLISLGVILLLVNGWFGCYTIDQLVNPYKKPPEPGEPSHGAAIGVVERLLIVGLVLVGHWEGIAGILAVKTIARFGEFSGDGGHRFAEQFILGTLTSVALAVFSATLVRWLVLGSL
jgi:hypothetical protein